MVDLSTLRDLQRRLREATGPDREIDADIAFHFGYVSEFFGDDASTLIVERMIDGPDLCGPGVYAGMGRGFTSPGFTLSIDATTALIERVLPDWSWDVRHSGVGVKGQGYLWHYMRRPGQGCDSDRVDAASPALALLGSFVSALIAIEEGEESDNA